MIDTLIISPKDSLLIIAPEAVTQIAQRDVGYTMLGIIIVLFIGLGFGYMLGRQK